MVQFKPTFKPGLLISSPAGLHHLFRRYDKTLTLTTEEWYTVFPGGGRFPLFVLDGRIWYVSLNKVCYDFRGWERREDRLPYKVAK